MSMGLVGRAKNSYRNLVSLEFRQKVAHWRAVMRRETGSLFVFHLRCKVCLGKNILRYRNPLVSRLVYGFYQCQDCDFIFVYPKPDLSAYYSEAAVPPLGEAEFVWNNHFLTSINKYAGGRGKLLEIGFGNASFLKLAQDDGWEVYGADISAPNVRHALEILNHANVQHATLEEASYPSNFFDVVAAFNFIEHVPDPWHTVKEFRRILRFGGLLVLLCPNLSGVYHRVLPDIFGAQDPLNITWTPPEHLSYFNKSNFKRLLERAGFTVVADESHLTSALWLQHQVAIGPKVTGVKLQRLLTEIESSALPKGDARVGRFRQQVSRLMLDRMLWTLVSDMMLLEPALGAENAVLYTSMKC